MVNPGAALSARRPQPSSSGLRVAATGRRVVIRLSGDFDIVAMPYLAARLACIRAVHQGTVVFDLRSVRFMDCASVRLIVRGSESSESGRPVLVGTPPAVRRLLEITGLDAECDMRD